ncbi:hypothetical protein AcV5_001630 [Taiwanofungus camphoratus]|nr:hypothetical protein AcV5_001630 [Antrodia cinnamomea]
MASVASSQFSKPTAPGDAISVLVLVEDSRAMLGKWDDVRNVYLPTLLETLRVADATVPMRVWWLTSSPAFTTLTTSVTYPGQSNEIPDLKIGQSQETAISTNTIRRSIEIYVANTGHYRSTRHFVMIAASRILDGIEGPGAMQSGIDPWHGIAMAFTRECIRLHLILDAAPETKCCYELFRRTLYLQNHADLPLWFPVDTSRFSIHLSSSVSHHIRGAVELPDRTSLSFANDMRSSPETPISSLSASQPSSPTHPSPGRGRRSSLTATSAPRVKARNGESGGLLSDGPGLVTYLQQMHGLTKKRSYGVKAGKRTLGIDMRGPNGSRPILPRLELPASPLHTLPVSRTTDGSDFNTSDSIPSTGNRQSGLLASRSSMDDRRAHHRSSWHPLPADSPVLDSLATTRDSTTAALRSLQSMSPRLTEFHNMNPIKGSMADRVYDSRGLGHGTELSRASAYPHTVPTSQSQTQLSTTNAPAFLASSTHPPILNRTYILGDISTPPLTPPRHSVSYTNTPMSSQMSTPFPSPSLTEPTSLLDNSEDQPFIVTPEYEAFVNARFEEAGFASTYSPHQLHSLQQISYPFQQHDFVSGMVQDKEPQWNGHQGDVPDGSGYDTFARGNWYAS